MMTMMTASTSQSTSQISDDHCDEQLMANGAPPADTTMPEDDPNGNVATSTIGASTERWGPRSAGAKQLASMYSREKRMQEYACIIVALVLMVVDLFFLLQRRHMCSWIVIVVSALFGILMADFGSGLIHWASDTWGTVEWPFLGKNFIRPFREHHVDPTAITRHDFVEVNGDSFMVCLVPLAVVCRSHCVNAETDLWIGWHWFWLLWCGYVSITNQIHKWSHTYFGLPRYVAVLQRCRIILPRLHHKVHHVSPHELNYCITTGWLNPLLDATGFWRGAESLITALTGLKPRSDDMKWAMVDKPKESLDVIRKEFIKAE